jgi:hypothetical protein
MKEHYCTYCGKDTYDVDIEYLIGGSHLACVLADSIGKEKKMNKKKPLEISNWDKLVGNKFDVMGASFIISVAHKDSSNKGDVYTAWVHGEDDTEPFVRVTLFADNMDMQVKVLPPIKYDSNMTPYDLTSTITKNHISNPSIFIQTIAEGLASDSVTRDILSYISRMQDIARRPSHYSKPTGYSPGPGINGSSGNNLW